MEIGIGSLWRCIDEDLEQYGSIGKVLCANNKSGLNGDGEVEIQHDDHGSYVMKVRRFLFRYEPV